VLFALAALVGAAVAVLPALAAAPAEVKLEVNNNCVEPNWPCWATPGSGSPASTVTIAAGGEIVFTDHASTAADVVWLGSAPACAGVPTSAMTGWEGKCKFEAPGRYKFESSTRWPEYTKYEVVVESVSTGTTSTTTTTTPPTTPTTTATTPGEPSHGTPQEGLGVLELAASQRGSAVRGQVEVPRAGSGGRLEIDLLAKANGHPVKVGRLIRPALAAGKLSFSVPLNAKGNASLHRRRRLAVTVKITLTPAHGQALALTRTVVLRS